MATFAIAAFAVGIVAIAALDRVGAPDRLVRALGPICVLFGVTVIGLGARNSDLGSFMAARRRVRPLYGALNVAAVAAGLALCLDPGFATPRDPPWPGVLAGIALGAAGFGPLLRRFGATAYSDVIATRFSRSPVRLASSLAIWTAAALTAVAGYETAVAATRALVTSNRAWAETIVAGVIWCGAAGAGALAMIVGLGVAAAWRLGLTPPDLSATAASASIAMSSPSSAALVVSTAIAIGVFFPFESAAVASPDARAAAKAGLGGFALCVTLALMASASLSVFPIDSKASPSNTTAASLTGAAALAVALALARAGVHASSRAFGVALADPPKPFPTLASVRLARMRAAQAIVIVCCAAFDAQRLIDARTALTIALALSLALTAPIVALAAIARVGPASASVALLTTVAVAAALVRANTAVGLPDAAELFGYALTAAAAAFLTGSLTCFVGPRRKPPPTPSAFDPYSEAIGSSGRKVAEHSIRP